MVTRKSNREKNVDEELKFFTQLKICYLVITSKPTLNFFSESVAFSPANLMKVTSLFISKEFCDF